MSKNFLLILVLNSQSKGEKRFDYNDNNNSEISNKHSKRQRSISSSLFTIGFQILHPLSQLDSSLLRAEASREPVFINSASPPSSQSSPSKQQQKSRSWYSKQSSGFNSRFGFDTSLL